MIKSHQLPKNTHSKTLDIHWDSGISSRKYIKGKRYIYIWGSIFIYVVTGFGRLCGWFSLCKNTICTVQPYCVGLCVCVSSGFASKIDSYVLECIYVQLKFLHVPLEINRCGNFTLE